MQKSSYHDKLAAGLKRVRLKAGLGQRQLATLLNTNQTRISLIESGDQYVRVGDLIDWCRVAGADPVRVLGEVIHDEP